MQNILIEKLKEGNNEAFIELINEHRARVLNICYGFVRNQEEAEDITQEVFIEVFRSISQFRGDSKISTWIYRIAVTRSLNSIKKNRFKQFLTSIETHVESFFATKNDLNPEQKLEQKEQNRIINNAINKLPENQRIAFMLYNYDGFSYNNIAEIMNTSLSSVESLIFRAKQNLKKKLVTKQ